MDRYRDRVSRFDGTHFKTFTTADGLPDIEVLGMFTDTKGRVWMAPFRKSICYYYKGKIHNQENDSLLHRIPIKNNIERFAEDAAGNVLLTEKSALLLIGKDGSFREYDSIAGQPISNCTAVSRSVSGHFLVLVDDQVFNFDGERFVPLTTIPVLNKIPVLIAMNPYGMVWRLDVDHSAVCSFADKKTTILPFEQYHFRHITFSSVDDSLFFHNETSGTTQYNMRTGVTKRYLEGREVSCTFRDAEGDLWFTTLGQGIFRLNSDEFRTIRLRSSSGVDESSVSAIKRIDNQLAVGNDLNDVFLFSLPDMTLQRQGSVSGRSKRRIMWFGKMQDDLLIGTNFAIEKSTTGLRYKNHITVGNAKSIFEMDSHQLLIGTDSVVELFDLSQFRLKEILWRDRTTTVFHDKGNDVLYIGTLNGLYALQPDKTSHFLGSSIPFFQKRISALAESADGVLWVASYDAGIAGYKDGRIITTITSRQGLTSDICRTILIQGTNLWIGTDKGLNKVDLSRPDHPVTRFTANDGLGSDMVNTLFADSSLIYVGTTGGLSYFDEKKVDLSEGCRLYLLSVLNEGKEKIGDTARLVLPYTDKYLRLEFAGISYRSVGSMTYRYRLLGLDTAWRETKETALEYPALPSGTFRLQLQGINKFGVSSPILTLPVRVEAPFWQRPWFYALAGIVFFLLVWLLVTFRIKYIRRRQRAAEKLNQRMAELEHTALQSQMNPHFIFNCLNSIQQYIFDQEVLAANKYLTGFARLIRATLHNSSRAFISLGEEVDYLTTYLSLEKLRFKEKMSYRVETDPGINKGLYLIPPMLIQPYVENSMRHGLRHKTIGDGYIHIVFSRGDDKLVVTIEDNGIGRKQAAVYKTREHIEYQSQGMSLTADRIRMINLKYQEQILVEVIDLEDSQGNSAGTRVIMRFPLFHILSPKDTL